ncbi:MULTISPECIES: head-tail connector protein [unclassified Methylobacterium]|uniref:head-tail connector protein n=1 Tax=unclassified Methylobacterium TaxID=2615210 RepID=UPI0006F7A721|nr:MULTISPECIES: hypothetical protein [unclassified Methylobacterium]KQP29441.1 hypothetical protein ASF25_20145 [Methylobacterium sp. Leaf100]KQP60897.1 hypothetical protein ASF52_07150 [Methylobacterium sp. Leaf112]USU33856.1 hypothetical protein NG677_09435 [Methylobacterium sp. OTU13CASTA1]
MTPIRVAGATVEPVSLGEMRAHLRLDSDEGGAEDALLAALVASARASVEAATRRILAPGRYRIMLTAWPASGFVPLPLSPLVAVERAGLVDAEGTVTDLAPGLVRPGPDPVEAPGLVVSPEAPSLHARAALVEVSAGYGGDGPPAPPMLLQAIRLLAAHGFEHRGDTGAGPPPSVAALVAPLRRLSL